MLKYDYLHVFIRLPLPRPRGDGGGDVTTSTKPFATGINHVLDRRRQFIEYPLRLARTPTTFQPGAMVLMGSPRNSAIKCPAEFGRGQFKLARAVLKARAAARLPGGGARHDGFPRLRVGGMKNHKFSLNETPHRSDNNIL